MTIYALFHSQTQMALRMTGAESEKGCSKGREKETARGKSGKQRKRARQRQRQREDSTKGK